MRRRLLKIALAVLLAVPVAVLALAPSTEEIQNRSQAGTVMTVVPRAAATARPAMPEEAAMVLAGTVLIGIAAAVRRAA